MILTFVSFILALIMFSASSHAPNMMTQQHYQQIAYIFVATTLICGAIAWSKSTSKN